MYIFPYMLRPENCHCQTCEALRRQQEVERIARVLANWPRAIR